MEAQLFAQLRDGRLVAVKNYDGCVVSIPIKRGVVLNIPASMVKRFQCKVG